MLESQGEYNDLKHVWWMMVGLAILEYVFHCSFALSYTTVLLRVCDTWMCNVSVPAWTDTWGI